METTDNLRTEQYAIAIGRGMITDADRDIVTAGGWASRYNQLGQLIVQFENTIDRRRRTYDKAKRADLMGFLIAALAVDSGLHIEESRDLADMAVHWRTERWCRFCNGAEALNPEQTQCPVCMGAREIPKPLHTERILAEMAAAVDAFERQLSGYMRGVGSEHKQATRTLNILGSDCGTYTPPVYLAE